MKFLRRIRARARYIVDRAFAREFAAQLGLFVLLVFVVTLIGMTAVFFGLFSPQNAEVTAIPRDIDGSFLDALWWSVNHVLSLPEFERMYGASGIVLAYSFALSLVGVAVFGILISLINNSMRSRIDSLRRGDTPVLEKEHILILGWSSVTVAVLRQLSKLCPGARVVILAPLEIDSMREQLRVAGIPLLKLTVILRSGVTSNNAELDRVAVLQASSIIVLAGGTGDSEVIKTLVQLATRKGWPAAQPTITAEVKEEMNSELAQIASRSRAHVVTSSSLISRVIVQTIRNPGLSSVIGEIGSMSGNNLHVQHIPKIAGKTVEEIAHHFPAAIPMGVSWRKKDGAGQEHAVALNPEPDYDLADDDRIVFLSREMPIRYVPNPYVVQENIVTSPPTVPNVPERILILGWSDIIDDMLLQIDEHAVRGTRISVLTEKVNAQVEEQIAQSQTAPFRNIEIKIMQGDAASASVYEELDLSSYDCVVVLASTESEDADTQTLRILLRLFDLRTYDTQRAHTIVELTDETNKDMFLDLGVDDIVVSTDIISASLAQVAQESVLGPIFRELLRVGGVEISLRPLTDYIPLGSEFSFDDLTHSAQRKLEVALGVWSGEGEKVDLNPDRKQVWTVSDGDKIAVLAQQIYH
jgi:Trk K+ transport system NAD-binding subunit